MRRVLHCAFASFALLAFAISAHAQVEREVIEIGQVSTTHILFTTDLTYVDISSQDCIAAKVVDASKNMLALKARKEFDFVTTISALESNGTMHTFMVKYNPFPSKLLLDIRPGASNTYGQVNTQVRPDEGTVSMPVQDPSKNKLGKKSSEGKPEQQVAVAQAPSPVTDGSVNVSAESSNFGRKDAPTLEEVINKPQQLFHIGDKNYRLEAYCINVFVYSDLTYIVFSLKNGSDIGYEAGDAQFTIENRKKTAKNIATDKAIWPKSSYGTLSCAPGSTTVVGYTVPKFTLLPDEVLKVYIYEKVGNRNLVMTLSDKDINYAVSPM